MKKSTEQLKTQLLEQFKENFVSRHLGVIRPLFYEDIEPFLSSMLEQLEESLSREHEQERMKLLAIIEQVKEETQEVVREKVIRHIEGDIHENEQDPAIAIINVKLYLESLKKEKNE